MSSKKYSRDFKLKVLEYYFEHGGDKKFGLKAKTAHHFCIDHKTVSRMLCNSEIVKKARRILGKKNVSDGGCKTSNSSKHQGLKIGQPYVDVQKMNLNLSSSSTSSKKNISLPCSSSSKASTQSSSSSKKVSSQKTSSEVPVIDLPEDPDFSILKSSIESSASSVSNVAKLLISGTKEVKRIITNECDLIYECKVCRNLFRSVINFLAHKRIYCQEEYTDVKGSFHKNAGLNMTSESLTVIVNPEPPPPEAPPIIQECKASTRKIDQIASRLARSKTKRSGEVLSHPSQKGSSAYFRRIETVNNARKSLGTDCSVLLKDIAGVSTAVYQSVNPVGIVEEKNTTKRSTSHQRKRERPVQLNADGQVVEKGKDSESQSPSVPKKIAVVCKEEPTLEEDVEVSCSTCGSTFSSQNLLDSHVAEVHGIERTVYTCPICNMVFLSIWGCVKHLIRIHKKKKHQRERLKHVICSRAYKKVFTSKEIARQNHKTVAQVAKVFENNREDVEKETLFQKDEKESLTPSSPSSLGSVQEEKLNTGNGDVGSQQKKQQPRVLKENVNRIGLHVDEEPMTYVRNKESRLGGNDTRECGIGGCGKELSSSSTRLTNEQPPCEFESSLTSEEPQTDLSSISTLRLLTTAASPIKLKDIKISSTNIRTNLRSSRRKRAKPALTITPPPTTTPPPATNNITPPPATTTITPTTKEQVEKVSSNKDSVPPLLLKCNIKGVKISKPSCKETPKSDCVSTPKNSNQCLKNSSNSNKYSDKFAHKYDLGCSFLRNFEFEKRLNSQNPIDYLFDKVRYGVVKPEEEVKMKSLNEFCGEELTIKLENESDDSSYEEQIRNFGSEEEEEEEENRNLENEFLLSDDVKIKFEDLSSLPNLVVTMKPYIENDYNTKLDIKLENEFIEGVLNDDDEDTVVLEIKDEPPQIVMECVSLFPSCEENNDIHSATLEQDSVSGLEKSRENELKDVMNPNDEKSCLDDPNDLRSKSTHLDITTHDDSKNKVPVLVIKKTGSSESSSDEWLVTNDTLANDSDIDKSSTDKENSTNSVSCKAPISLTEIGKIISPEKCQKFVDDATNSDLTLTFKRVDLHSSKKETLSSEYKVVKSKLKEERKLKTLKIKELNESRPKVQSSSDEGDKEKERLHKLPKLSVVPPLKLYKKENLYVESFPIKKRFKSIDHSLGETSPCERDNNFDDCENLSIKIYPKVSYTAKTRKRFHSPDDIYHSTTPETAESLSTLDARINPNLASTSKIIHFSSKMLQDSMCATESADRVTVKELDLDLHSNVSFGKLSFDDTSCMPTEVIPFSKKKTKKG